MMGHAQEMRDKLVNKIGPQSKKSSSNWARMKESEKVLSDLKMYKTYRMRLHLACAVVGMGGLFLAVCAAEMCRFGYVPTPQETGAGLTDPYDDPAAGVHVDMRYGMPRASAVAWSSADARACGARPSACCSLPRRKSPARRRLARALAVPARMPGACLEQLKPQGAMSTHHAGRLPVGSRRPCPSAHTCAAVVGCSRSGCWGSCLDCCMRAPSLSAQGVLTC